MLEDKFFQVYNKFKIHFYQQIFKRSGENNMTLTTVECFCMEGIAALGEPTVAEFAHFMNISTPNAAYKVNSLVNKGFLERIQSKTDRREYHLRPSDKYNKYNNITSSYIKEVMKRIRENFSDDDVKKLNDILSTIGEDLMPEIQLPK